MAEYIKRSVGVSVLRAKANMAVLSDAALYFEKAAQMLEKLPAADVAPVVRSYWESYDCSQYMGTNEDGEPKWRDGKFYICHNRKCRRKTVIKSPYCPNCGAKMDGGADHGKEEI